MAVVIETTLGDFTVDLYIEDRPHTCKNFLKLCKMKYYHFCLFHSVQHNFIAQTGDPSGTGKGGESVFGKIHGGDKKFFEAEMMPKVKHTKSGLLSMVNCGNNMLGSQFFLTLGSELQSLDNEHCVFGEVSEGQEILLKLNDVICDTDHRPYQDIRITHTVILEDPFDDPPGLIVPDNSPEPSKETLLNARIAPDEELDETKGRSAAELEEMAREREAKARATILEIVGDIPDAEIAPPENILFVCKLNPVTTDDDLEIIFSRFGKVKSCEVIRDKITGDSLQYAFVEFEEQKSCEDAFFKMDNVLIDDRRIHVDFSQSVSKLRWKGKGRGVEHVDHQNDTKKTSHQNPKKPQESKRSKEDQSNMNDKQEQSRNQRSSRHGYNTEKGFKERPIKRVELKENTEFEDEGSLRKSRVEINDHHRNDEDALKAVSDKSKTEKRRPVDKSHDDREKRRPLDKSHDDREKINKPYQEHVRPGDKCRSHTKKNEKDANRRHHEESGDKYNHKGERDTRYHEYGNSSKYRDDGVRGSDVHGRKRAVHDREYSSSEKKRENHYESERDTNYRGHSGSRDSFRNENASKRENDTRKQEFTSSSERPKDKRGNVNTKIGDKESTSYSKSAQEEGRRLACVQGGEIFVSVEKRKISRNNHGEKCKESEDTRHYREEEQVDQTKSKKQRLEVDRNSSIKNSRVHDGKHSQSEKDLGHGDSLSRENDDSKTYAKKQSMKSTKIKKRSLPSSSESESSSTSSTSSDTSSSSSESSDKKSRAKRKKLSKTVSVKKGIVRSDKKHKGKNIKQSVKKRKRKQSSSDASDSDSDTSSSSSSGNERKKRHSSKKSKRR